MTFKHLYGLVLGSIPASSKLFLVISHNLWPITYAQYKSRSKCMSQYSCLLEKQFFHLSIRTFTWGAITFTTVFSFVLIVCYETKHYLLLYVRLTPLTFYMGRRGHMEALISTTKG